MLTKIIQNMHFSQPIYPKSVIKDKNYVCISVEQLANALKWSEQQKYNRGMPNLTMAEQKFLHTGQLNNQPLQLTLETLVSQQVFIFYFEDHHMSANIVHLSLPNLCINIMCQHKCFCRTSSKSINMMC